MWCSVSLSLRSYSSKQAGEEDFPGPPCSSSTGQCSGGAPPSSFMLLGGSPVRWRRLATSVSITPGDGSVEASTVQACRWQLYTHFLHWPSCPVLCPLSGEGLCLASPHIGLSPSAHKVKMEQFFIVIVIINPLIKVSFIRVNILPLSPLPLFESTSIGLASLRSPSSDFN